MLFFCFALFFLISRCDVSVKSGDNLGLHFSNGDITDMDIDGKSLSSSTVGGFSGKIFGEEYSDNLYGDELLKNDKWQRLNAEDNDNGTLKVYGKNKNWPIYQAVKVTPDVSAVFISGESKPFGFPDGNNTQDLNYCVYVDVIYKDNSWAPSQMLAFPPYADGFIYKSMLFSFTKPVATVSVNLYLRGYRATESDYALFRNLSVRAYRHSRFENGVSTAVTGNLVHLSASMHNLTLESEFESSDTHITIKGNVTNTDTRKASRGLTLILSLPLDANTPTDTDGAGPSYAGWNWGSGETSVPLEPGLSALDTSPRTLGGRKIDTFPAAGISNDTVGLGVGVPLDEVLVWRFSYNGVTKMLTVEIDFMMTSYNRQPNVSSFSIVVFKLTNPSSKWPWRAAWQKYTRAVFAGVFQTNVILDQGLWMCQGLTSAIPGWEDFGIKFYEGDWEPRWTVEHDIYLFPYIEPNLIFLNESKLNFDITQPTVPQLPDMCLTNSTWCRSVQTSYMVTANGNVLFHKDGDLIFTVNLATVLEPVEYNHATHEMDQIEVTYEYAKKCGAVPHGIYLDSLETTQGGMDYRRETFKYSIFDPVFDGNGRAWLPSYAGTVDFVRALKKNMLNDRPRTPSYVMANTVLQFRNPHMAIGVDVFGAEVASFWDGKWHGNVSGREEVNGGVLRRVLADQKPLVVLDYSPRKNWTHDFTECYLDENLLYGVWPSFDTWSFFEKLDVVERDRDLFKHYIPLYRAVTSKGWEAVPCVTLRNVSGPNGAEDIPQGKLRVERWGHVSPFMYTLRFMTPVWGPSHSVLLDFDEACLLSTPTQQYRYPSGSSTTPTPTHTHSILITDRTQGVGPDDGEGTVVGREWTGVQFGPGKYNRTFVLEVTLGTLDSDSGNGSDDSTGSTETGAGHRADGDGDGDGGSNTTLPSEGKLKTKTSINFVIIIAVAGGVVVVVVVVIVIGAVLLNRRRKRRRSERERESNNDDSSSSSFLSPGSDHTLRTRQSELKANSPYNQASNLNNHS